MIKILSFHIAAVQLIVNTGSGRRLRTKTIVQVDITTVSQGMQLGVQIMGRFAVIGA